MFVRGETITATLSTVGTSTAYSADVYNGLLQSVYVSISKAIGASGKVTVTSESTQLAILTVVDPSTLGAWFQPVQIMHGTTGNALNSTEFRTLIPLLDERVKVKVASSSGLSAETVTVKFKMV